MKQTKIIGILGGMSHESTVEIENLIVKMFKERTQGKVLPKFVLFEVDMIEIRQLQESGKWREIGHLLGMAAREYLTPADFIVIVSNTMHKVVDDIERISGKKVLSIIDITVNVLKDKGYKKIGLLGTPTTMYDTFYKDKLTDLGVIVDVPFGRFGFQIGDIISDELCDGVIKESSRQLVEGVMANMKSRGAEAVILGCTDLPLLIKDGPLPLVNTNYLYAQAIVHEALN